MKLVYYPQQGYGEMLPSKPFVYDQAYFNNYAELSDTPVGVALNTVRVRFVQKHWEGKVLDVGVGSGAFIERLGQVCGDGHVVGYDVPGPSRTWLRDHGLFHDPERDGRTPVATFWDSLEHMTYLDARNFMEHVRHKAFISTPIYENGDAILDSHHFKPGEHILYFTERGLISWMFDRGFKLLERNRMEEAYGRSGIGTYVFYRS